MLDLQPTQSPLVHAHGWRQYITHIECKRIALEEHLQVRVLLQHGVVRDLLDALLEREAALLNEVLVEAAVRVLVGNGRDDDTRVVLRERLVQPEEVGVPPQDGELGFAVER